MLPFSFNKIIHNLKIKAMNNNSNNPSTFDILSAIDVSQFVEKKQNGLSYLSWSVAWKLLKQNFPDATFEKRYWNDKPYLFDPDLGYYVEVSVTIQGETQTMGLFVMDGANKAMKNVPYTYMTKFGEKQVEAATMASINTTIQRALTKAIALHGLGLSLYISEDLHDINAETVTQEQKPVTARKTRAANPPAPDKYAGIRTAINTCGTPDDLYALYYQHKQEVDGNVEVKALFTQRKEQLLNAA